jgi:hypothetical protein
MIWLMLGCAKLLDGSGVWMMVKLTSQHSRAASETVVRVSPISRRGSSQAARHGPDTAYSRTLAYAIGWGIGDWGAI